jgi:hypothetical protein
LFPSRINARAVAVAIVLGTAMTGCSDVYTDRRQNIGLSAGDALAANQVTQMVDPWPVASANRNIGFNGEKMQSAVERYRTNKIFQPVNATTSSSSYQQQQPQAQSAASGKP